MLRLPSTFILALALAVPWCRADDASAEVWAPDRGDGTYQNPVLFADYSDPDAIRVGDDFYLVSSSFHCVPGLPILHSKDLVNWTIINHALPALQPVGHFSLPRHGEGVWAPAIRYHDGKFWIYYPDPDFGIYLTTATDPAGAWTPPILVKAGQGLEDPCPFWDDDGQCYLVHAWARSRSGISNRLTLLHLSADGTKALDDGQVIIDADKIPNWRTLEGPKLYKRAGYYYIFAPAGGVTDGYQAVFRAKKIAGPYEHRIVLDQGRTQINGPHQGAWVDTPAGEDWFLHFQDRGAFGRVVHLEPMTWRDDWPVIGSDPDGDGKGEPVLVHKKPDVGRDYPAAVPQTSDEFAGSVPGLQWQWQANPRPDWSPAGAQTGWLRLACVPRPPPGKNLWLAGNLLLQKFTGPAFSATTSLKFEPAISGESAGLIIFGADYAWIGLRKSEKGLQVAEVVCQDAAVKGQIEQDVAVIDAPSEKVFLRVNMNESATCHFSYSFDGKTFLSLGSAFTAKPDRWVGAKVGIFASSSVAKKGLGHADFDWFRLSPLFR
ncbi:MAG: glycoside hydrolase 43 family protein [Verrucomicrobiota bacterium]|nr:glycoside hydrolase 43 family protein [Verrucomicrobiota bacterium]